MILITPLFGMVSLSIKSLQHPIVKKLVQIRKIPAEFDQVLILGKKMVLEISQSFPLEVLVLQDHLNPTDFPPARQTYFANEAILKKITGLPSSDGVCAVLKKPEYADLSDKTRILVLDHISDPGNLGTLLRTALALGYHGAYLIGGVCPFNDKALRAAKGATFYLPLQIGSSSSFIDFLKQAKMTAVLAALHGKPLSTFQAKEPFALVLGNEARGASPDLIKHCQPVTIPMSEKSESLNVAVAGGILLYALVQ